MGLTLETSPASEPLTLAEVKAFLRLGGLGAGGRISAVIGTAGYVTTLNVVAAGSGYPSSTTATLSGGTTANVATATLTISGGSITAAAVASSGSGYTVAPVVVLSGGDWAYEDTTLELLIAAARSHAEEYTQRQFISAGWKFTGQPDANGRMILPKTPLVSVNTVNYYDTAGTVCTASSDTYVVYSDQEPASIVFTTLPAYDTTRDDAVQVHFTAGYTTVPSGIKLALLWTVGDAYLNRDNPETKVNEMIGRSPASERMLDMFRVWRSAS